MFGIQWTKKKASHPEETKIPAPAPSLPAAARRVDSKEERECDEEEKVDALIIAAEEAKEAEKAEKAEAAKSAKSAKSTEVLLPIGELPSDKGIDSERKKLGKVTLKGRVPNISRIGGAAADGGGGGAAGSMANRALMLTSDAPMEMDVRGTAGRGRRAPVATIVNVAEMFTLSIRNQNRQMQEALRQSAQLSTKMLQMTMRETAGMMSTSLDRMAAGYQGILREALGGMRDMLGRQAESNAAAMQESEHRNQEYTLRLVQAAKGDQAAPAPPPPPSGYGGIPQNFGRGASPNQYRSGQVQIPGVPSEEQAGWYEHYKP